MAEAPDIEERLRKLEGEVAALNRYIASVDHRVSTAEASKAEERKVAGWGLVLWVSFCAICLAVFLLLR